MSASARITPRPSWRRASHPNADRVDETLHLEDRERRRIDGDVHARDRALEAIGVAIHLRDLVAEVGADGEAVVRRRQQRAREGVLGRFTVADPERTAAVERARR